MRWLVILVMLADCKDPPAAVDAAPVTTATTASTIATTTPAPTATHTANVPAAPIDAGALACKLMSGPEKLAKPGPYAIIARYGSVDVYAKDGDKPALAGSVRVEARIPMMVTVSSPPAACAAAGTFVFCTNSAGEIRRYKTSPAIESDNFVARARPGAPISAALVNGHTVVAYLRERMTSEGNTSEAFAESDDGTETRLSEDGSGATSVALAPRGEGAIAVYVDARRAMTPVHARTLTVSPKLALGKDAVLFVAGTAETNTRATLGVKGKTAFVLLPVAHDLAFGLATVKIDGEPATDAPTTWSDYPNGLDPAPIAGTADGALVVARVRPSAAKFGSPRALELGTIDDKGAFSAYGIFPTTGDVTNVSVASDGATGAAIAYTDASGGQAIRVSCPK
ncbi:MAG TPA: hypothetical protein VGH87_20305 [Polyangiaceae bacterium]